MGSKKKRKNYHAQRLNLELAVKETHYYLNDRFVPASEAKVSVLDLGLLRGYGVFDYLRTYHKQPFHIEDHLKRFENSCSQIGLKCPKSLDEIHALVNEILKLNDFEETSLKIVLTGGVSSDHITPQNRPTFMIIAYPFEHPAETCYRDGIDLLSTPFIRPFADVKTLQYLPAIVAQEKAKKMGYFDALFVGEDGEVFEAGTANIFFTQPGKLITPSRGVLPGITRKILLDLMAKEYAIEVRPCYLNELETFNGAFLTSSNKEVMPIKRINSHNFSSISEETHKSHEHFKAYSKNFLNLFSKLSMA